MLFFYMQMDTTEEPLKNISFSTTGEQTAKDQDALSVGKAKDAGGLVQGGSSGNGVKMYFGSKNNKQVADRFNVCKKRGIKDDFQVHVLNKWVKSFQDTVRKFLCDQPQARIFRDGSSPLPFVANLSDYPPPQSMHRNCLITLWVGQLHPPDISSKLLYL